MGTERVTHFHPRFVLREHGACTLSRNPPESYRMGESPISDRANEWRRDAEVFRRYGQEALAALLEKLATDLEADCLSADERVSFADAPHLSGYSQAHLRRLVRQGKLTNLGSKKKPEFLLSDLPRKPGYNPENKRLVPETDTSQIEKYKQVARAVVQGG